MPYCLVFLLVFLSLPLAGQAQLPVAPYTFVTIAVPTPEGYTFAPVGDPAQTVVQDIGEAGELVGTFVQGTVPGFVLGDRLRLTVAACPAGGVALPNSINRHFAMAGSCFGGHEQGGFLRRRQGGKVVTLPIVVPGATLTDVRGLNDAHQVVGTFFDGASQTYHGFLWTDGSVQVLNAPFPDAFTTVLTGINNRGDLVGFTTPDLVTPSPENTSA